MRQAVDTTSGRVEVGAGKGADRLNHLAVYVFDLIDTQTSRLTPIDANTLTTLTGARRRYLLHPTPANWAVPRAAVG